MNYTKNWGKSVERYKAFGRVKCWTDAVFPSRHLNVR